MDFSGGPVWTFQQDLCGLFRGVCMAFSGGVCVDFAGGYNCSGGRFQCLARFSIKSRSLQLLLSLDWSRSRHPCLGAKPSEYDVHRNNKRS